MEYKTVVSERKETCEVSPVVLCLQTSSTTLSREGQPWYKSLTEFRRHGKFRKAEAVRICRTEY